MVAGQRGGLSPRGRDLVSGALCIAGGIGVLIEARRLGVGSLDHLGAGFYPAALGGLLLAVGLLVAGTALVMAQQPDDTPHDAILAPDWRGGACIIGAVAAFVLFADLMGLAPAVFFCAFIGALGDRSGTVRGSLILAVGMAIACTVLFGYLLGVNMPLWQWPFAP